MENGFQGGKLTGHSIAKITTISLLVVYQLDHLWDEAGVKRGRQRVSREQFVRRRPGCANKRGRTETKNVIVKLKLPSNVCTAKFAGARKFTVSICTDLLGAILPERPVSFKKVQFIVGSGREGKPREAKDGRGKLKGDIQPIRKIPSSLSVKVPGRLGSKTCTSSTCLFGTFVSRYEDVNWSPHMASGHNIMMKEHNLR